MSAAQDETQALPGPLGRWAGDAIAIAFIIIVALGIMREHLAGTGLFLGNYDRLGYFLAARLNELDAIRSQGGPVTWNDTLFMGFNSANLPGAVSPFSPMRLVTAFASRQEFYFWAGVSVAGVMTLAGIAAYGCLRRLKLGAVASWIGALVYMCTTHSMIRFAQTDTSSLLLAALPAGVVLLCGCRPGNVGRSTLGITLLSTMIFFSSAGPPTIYVIGFWAVLVLFLAVRNRTTIPLWVGGWGVLSGLIIAVPQLWGVAAELKNFVREGGVGTSFEAVYGFFNVSSHEVLRAFDEGIFGRTGTEVSALGNNLNLSEGFQIYAGTFATLSVLALLLRHRGEWLRVFKLRDGIFSLLAWALLASSIVILVKPAAELLFTIFLQAKLIHARLSIIATLAMAALVGLAVQQLIHIAARRPFTRSLPLAISAALLILLGLNWLATKPLTPAKIDLQGTWSEITWQLLNAGASICGSNSNLRAPAAVKASRTAPTTIRLQWQHRGPPPEQFEISMGRDGGPLTVIGHTAARNYGINDIDPTADYRFSLRAVSADYASPPSPPILAELFDPSRIAPAPRPAAPVWILANRALALLASFPIFVGLLILARRSCLLGTFAAQTLLCLIGLQVASEADRRWNGPENRSFPRPFAENSYFVAPPEVLRSGNDEARSALHHQLAPARYRTVYIPEAGQFSHSVAPHVSSYWGLRTVEGYLSGLPVRLAALAWPPGVAGFRTLSFNDETELPWDLLGLLNVRQAVVVDTPLYFDTPRDPHSPQSPFSGTSKLRLIPNPAPVVPREFFAARTIPTAPFDRAIPPPLLTAQAAWSAPRVEGLDDEHAWPTIGELRATYRGDHVTVEVSPFDQARFLVLNELYHPRWSARADGRDLQIYPVNTVMRGVQIPAGVTRVEFSFRPYSRFAAWWLWPTFGIMLAASGSVVLGRHFGAKTASSPATTS